jgi:threonine/homoserine/homoserine lactone efflux protein
MLSGILQGLILGFILTAIPGAVVLETTRRALTRLPVLNFLCGNFLGVGITIVITIVGLSSVLRDASLSHLFYLLSGATLIYIGVTSVASKKLAKSNRRLGKGHEAASPYKAFVAGLILATANPVSILFWITMIGRYFNAHDSHLQIALNSAAIVLGGVIFYMVLMVMTGITHKIISQRYLIVSSDVFGVIILVYGGFILSKAF